MERIFELARDLRAASTNPFITSGARLQLGDDLATAVINLMSPRGTPASHPAQLAQPTESSIISPPVQSQGYPKYTPEGNLIPSLLVPESLQSPANVTIIDMSEWPTRRRRREPMPQSYYTDLYGECSLYFLGKTHSEPEGTVTCVQTDTGEMLWALIPDDPNEV